MISIGNQKPCRKSVYVYEKMNTPDPFPAARETAYHLLFLLYAAYCVALGLLLPFHPLSMPPRPSLLPLRLDLSTRTDEGRLVLTLRGRLLADALVRDLVD